jgi:RNA polymerase sigma-32 factor
VHGRSTFGERGCPGEGRITSSLPSRPHIERGFASGSDQQLRQWLLGREILEFKFRRRPGENRKTGKEESEPMLNSVIYENSLRSYQSQINRFPLLAPEEEFNLAVRYRENGDLEAAHRLITSHLRFVVKIAFEYRFYGIKIADLVQEGNVGLILALKKFDPYQGHRFVSYAIWWVRACIQAFIVKNWSLVKIGTTQAQKKLFYKIGKIRKSLELNREEEQYEVLAKDLQVSKEDILEMEQRMTSKDLSLETIVDEDEKLNHLDLLRQDGPDQEEQLAEQEEIKHRERQISAAMKRLDGREGYVIRHRIMDDDPLTLQKIGSHLGISRERVRQIQGEALKKLRRELCSAVDLIGTPPYPNSTLNAKELCGGLS